MALSKNITGALQPTRKDWQAAKNLKTQNRIATPKQLWDFAMDYFTEVDENPFCVAETVKSGESAGCVIYTPVQRPYTMKGLKAFLFAAGYARNFDAIYYNRDNSFPEFTGVASQIHDLIYNQKFEGAAVDVFNASIISRDLGLVDRTASLHTVSETQSDIDFSLLSDEALQEIASLSELSSKECAED